MMPVSCSLTRAASRESENRDRLLISPELGCFMIADGVGKRPGAAAASAMAVETFAHALGRLGPVQRLGERCLRDACVRTHEQVHELPRSDPLFQGAATTLSVVVLVGQRGRFLHIGDGRILLYRKGHLRQLSEDHTIAAEVQRLGLQPNSSGQHPLAHMLTHHLGSERTPEPQLDTLT